MEEHDVCEVACVETEKVAHVQAELKKGNVPEVSRFFKVLSDETRMKIVFALTVEAELCVCDVAKIVGATTATASHHLRLLKNIGLAHYRKEGKLVYYSLVDEHVKQLIRLTCSRQEKLMELR